MKKLGRKVILAMVATLLLVVTMTTSTFAWISMINEVKADGMKFHVETPASLYISTNINGTGSTENEKYTDSVVFADAATKLYPASSIDGQTFCAVNEEKLNKVSDKGRTAAENIDKLTDNGYQKYNSLYGSATTGALYDAQAYVEYTFYLKLVTTDFDGEREKTVYLQEAKLLYADDGTDPEEVAGEDSFANCLRYAILVGEATISNGTATAPSAVTPMFVGSFLENFDEQAYNSSKALADVTLNDTGFEVMKLTAAGEKIVQVTVRIWFEGEDLDTYNKNFALLTDEYELSLKFGFEAATSGLFTAE